MSDEVRFVRLRPVDKKAGLTVRTFTQRYEGRFFKFKDPGVWYRVSSELAAVLEKARQIPTRPNSPTVFDVCDEKTARSLDHQAKIKRESEKAKAEPTVDTAKNLINESGRGDLSLEEVTNSRMKALEEVASRSSQGPEETSEADTLSEEIKPKLRTKPKRKSSKQSAKKK